MKIKGKLKPIREEAYFHENEARYIVEALEPEQEEIGMVTVDFNRHAVMIKTIDITWNSITNMELSWETFKNILLAANDYMTKYNQHIVYLEGEKDIDYTEYAEDKDTKNLPVVTAQFQLPMKEK